MMIVKTLVKTVLLNMEPLIVDFLFFLTINADGTFGSGVTGQVPHRVDRFHHVTGWDQADQVLQSVS